MRAGSLHPSPASSSLFQTYLLPGALFCRGCLESSSERDVVKLPRVAVTRLSVLVRRAWRCPRSCSRGVAALLPHAHRRRTFCAFLRCLDRVALAAVGPRCLSSARVSLFLCAARVDEPRPLAGAGAVCVPVLRARQSFVDNMPVRCRRLCSLQPAEAVDIVRQEDPPHCIQARVPLCALSRSRAPLIPCDACALLPLTRCCGRGGAQKVCPYASVWSLTFVLSAAQLVIFCIELIIGSTFDGARRSSPTGNKQRGSEGHGE